MKNFKRALVAAATVAFVLLNLALSGFVIASVHALRYWAYPTFFGISMFLSGIVLIVLVPKGKPMPSLEKIPWVGKRLKVDEKRFEKPFWRWCKAKGPFILTPAAAIVGGPLLAALVVRFLALEERKAWLCVFVANVIGVGYMVSFYLGLFGLIRAALSGLVH